MARLNPSLLVACLLAWPLSACRYNFVPLVPKEMAVELPPRVTTATLVREGEKLVVTARVDGKFKADYLKVEWFNSSLSLGTDSVYLDSAQPGARFEWPAPDKGAYRAVLSLGGAVVRQLELYEVQP